ncbi:MAG: hypothetical protein VB065_04360 [Eubacteriales bacterium]|nr:hypothetical protein [Eubacteriales bacterium]
MKQMVRCSLAFILVMALMVPSVAGFAEGYDMAVLTADSFRLIAGGSTTDIGAAVRLSAGIDEAMARGLLVADIYGGNAIVLQILLALEDAQIKGYMHNQSGGLSHLMQIPLQDIQEFLTSEAGAGMLLSQAPPVMESLAASIGSSTGAAYLNALADRIRHNAADEFAIQPMRRERIALFNQTVDAEVVEATLKLAQYLALIEEMAQSDPLLLAVWRQAGMLYEQHSGNALSEVPALLDAAGVETDVTIRLYDADEGAGRIVTDVLIAVGDEQMPVAVKIDYSAHEGNHAVYGEMTATLPGEGDVSMYVQTQDAVDADSSDAHAAAGLCATADGETSEVGFSIQKRSTEAGGVVTGGSIGDIIGKQTGGQGAATDSATILLKARIPDEQLDVSLDIQYDGTHYDQDGDRVWYGEVTFNIKQDKAEVGTLAFDTEYRLTHMPEGVLLSPGDMGVMNPLKADEASLGAFQESARAVLQNALAVAKQTTALDEILGIGYVRSVPADSYLTGEVMGTMAGVDAEAFTVQDQDGALFTFFFDSTFPRSALDEALSYASPVRVAYDGEFDGYGRFTGTFTVSADLGTDDAGDGE